MNQIFWWKWLITYLLINVVERADVDGPRSLQTLKYYGLFFPHSQIVNRKVKTFSSNLTSTFGLNQALISL